MTKTLHIEEANVSRAWARAFLEMMKPGVVEIMPLIITVTGLANDQPEEIPRIRQALDQALAEKKKSSCQTVASTIFPQSLWNPTKGRAELFGRYLNLLPRLKRHSENRYGLYFERLIAFNGINQLEHIIQTRLNGNRKRSALQAAIFDPTRDHTNQRRRGFPCLQHVVFTPHGCRELAVTGIYATQYLFDKAYGNYLGLCDLGRFVAYELGLQLTQLNCITNIALLGDFSKQSLSNLACQLKNILEGADSDGD